MMIVGWRKLAIEKCWTETKVADLVLDSLVAT